MSGHIPQQIPIQRLKLPRVEKPYLDCAVRLMVQMCEKPIEYCNPRVPYLFLAWLLVSSDNEYRATQYVNEGSMVRCVAAALISIACGEAPPVAKLEQIRKSASSVASSATWKAARLAVDSATHQKVEADRVLSAVAWTASNRMFHRRGAPLRQPQAIIRWLQQRAHEWCYISDSQVIAILYEMVWDIYGDEVDVMESIEATN
jgi:hypothetical protein